MEYLDHTANLTNATTGHLDSPKLDLEWVASNSTFAKKDRKENSDDRTQKDDYRNTILTFIDQRSS